MTVSRTIPENPKAGERYAKLYLSPIKAEIWIVHVMGTHPEVNSPIGVAFTEADARLLVFGAKAVEALRVCLDVMKRHGVPHTHPLLRYEWHEAVASGIATLAHLEGNRDRT